MRTLTVGAATSLDNFIARRDDTVDWLIWSDEVQAISAKFLKTVDTVLMGRRTYEVALRSGTSSYPGVRNIVFSRRGLRVKDKSVEVVTRNGMRFVQDLKEGRGKGICVMGGGRFSKSLFDADLVDEVGLNIHPVVLGSGIPFFLPMKKQLDLELKSCKVLKNGCVVVTYRRKM